MSIYLIAALIVALSVCLILYLKTVCDYLDTINFKLTRLESIYRTCIGLDSSIDTVKELLCSIEGRLFDNGAPGENIGNQAFTGNLEDDIKNIMNYTPSPKKRRELKRKAAENK